MTEFVQHDLTAETMMAAERRARQMRAEAVAEATRSVVAFLRAWFLRNDAPRTTGTARA